MSHRLRRGLLYAALALAFVLHNDLWLWEDPSRLGGLPVGLAYHVAFCLVTAALMALLVALDGSRGGAIEGAESGSRPGSGDSGPRS